MENDKAMLGFYGLINQIGQLTQLTIFNQLTKLLTLPALLF